MTLAALVDCLSPFWASWYGMQLVNAVAARVAAMSLRLRMTVVVDCEQWLCLLLSTWNWNRETAGAVFAASFSALRPNKEQADVPYLAHCTVSGGWLWHGATKPWTRTLLPARCETLAQERSCRRGVGLCICETRWPERMRVLWCQRRVLWLPSADSGCSALAER